MLLHGYNEIFTGFQEYDYAYYPGTNRLKNTDGSSNGHYQYDPSGNVTANSERGITNISYDPSTTLRTGHRNLAQEVFTGTGSHRYVYDHTGTRVGKQYKATGASNWAVNARYVYGAYGELLAQYNGLVLQYWNILTPDGEALGHHLGSTFDTSYRRYYLKDHTSTTLSTGLGSVRVTVTDEGTAIGWDDYFPFGLQMPGRSYNQGNAFDDQKFTGHFLEQEGDLGIYHAVARMYDPETGRFWGVDAMRGKYPGFSTYIYAANNPLIYIDPDGRDVTIYYDCDDDLNCSTFVFNGDNIEEGRKIGNEFINHFLDAYLYVLNSNAKSTIVKSVKNNNININITHFNNSKHNRTFTNNKHDGGFYDRRNNMILWIPYQGLLLPSGSVISPAVVLEHEFVHASEHANNPIDYVNRSKSDRENSAISAETLLAIELGELESSHPQRSHGDAIRVATYGPTSTQINRNWTYDYYNWLHYVHNNNWKDFSKHIELFRQ